MGLHEFITLLFLLYILCTRRCFTPNTQKLLKEQATNFLRRLFVGFQDRLGSQKGNTFKIIEDIEPFALPGFKNNPPKGTDFKKPFFDAGKLIFI